MESILQPTYGILIYQDDVMMIAVELAGFTWDDADKLRKAIGKKIPEMMAEQKEKTDHRVY
jgi:DNA polymerase-3 subunit alpha